MSSRRLHLVAAAFWTSCLPHCGLAPPTSVSGKVPSSADSKVAMIVAPDDGTGTILDAIRSARRRVWVEMYMLTASDAIDALVTARAAGRDVRVLLEPAPYGDETANQPTFTTLLAAGIDVRWFRVPGGLVHAKLVLVDDTAYVLTLNLTTAGLTRNREYAVVDPDPTDVRRAQAIWTADAIGGDPGDASADARIVASPIDARARLTEALDSARVSIALEIEELSDPDLVARLIAARAAGVAVSIVVPAANRSSATNGALAGLAEADVSVRALGAPTVHAKAMVIDGHAVYIGSVNFTRASLDDNREVGVLLENSIIAARVAATITADAARAASF